MIAFTFRKLIYAIPLFFGVTSICFTLMVYFGPDQTFEHIGKNATPEDIANVRAQLGYDQPIAMRYLKFITQILTLDFGTSTSSGEEVVSIIGRTAPVSLAVSLPGFFIGNILAIILSLIAASFRGKFIDKTIMGFSVMGMSISLIIVIIAFQYIFCSAFGLDWFPVQGWEVDGPKDYLTYVAVPTMTSVFVALGYNTRFFRGVLVEELERDYVRTAKAFGSSAFELMVGYVLKNALVPILTRIIFTLPFVLIGGSLLIEYFFSIPGIGSVTYDAITSGDLPVVQAIVSLSAVLYIFVLIATDIVYQTIDPRISIG